MGWGSTDFCAPRWLRPWRDERPADNSSQDGAAAAAAPSTRPKCRVVCVTSVMTQTAFPPGEQQYSPSSSFTANLNQILHLFYPLILHLCFISFIPETSHKTRKAQFPYCEVNFSSRLTISQCMMRINNVLVQGRSQVFVSGGGREQNGNVRGNTYKFQNLKFW